MEDDIIEIKNPENEDHYAHMRETDKHVQVKHKNTILADTESPLVLTENGKFLYDSVYYIPKEDVRIRMEVNEDKKTQCPIKGEASYWHWDELKNVAWSYDDPLDQAKILQDYLAFDLKKVDLLLLTL